MENEEFENYEFEERAGIYEYEGGLPRNEAEELSKDKLTSSHSPADINLELLKLKEEISPKSVSDNSQNESIKKQTDIIYQPHSDIITLKDFMQLNIKPIEWIIPELLPEGVTLLASRPKVGKSWMCLNIALSVARGIAVFNRFAVEPQKVLYITFEDNQERIFKRFSILLNSPLYHSDGVPENLILTQSLTCPPINEPYGLEFLTDMIQGYDIRLIIIDTLQKAISRNQNLKFISYREEYDLMSIFQRFALKHHICLLLVFHTTKAKQLEKESIIDEIQGTTGMTAGTDTILILKKAKSDHTLYFTGKDVIEDEIEVIFNKTHCTWTFKTELDKIDTTPERLEIIKLLELENREMRTSEIADKLGKSQNNISALLQKLVEENKIKKIKYGVYTI